MAHKGKNNSRKSVDDERKREAQRILNRVDREVEQAGASTMGRTANKVRDHLLGEEVPNDDAVEKIGKRIGRGLALVIFVVLAVSLYYTYIAPE